MGEVDLKNISKRFGDSHACKAINLDIREGEFFTFLGPSGCGKTTLLRLIAGFIQPEEGSIHIGGINVTTLPPEKRRVGMVFQNYALFPFMTVGENIEYGLRIQTKNKSEIQKKSRYYLEMVGLGGFETRAVSELSGGEQQRVAFARSLAVEPRVLLLDEPLSNLDAKLRDSMRDELKRLQKQLGITTIFVTHDQSEALSISDRIAVFNKGQCLQAGRPEQIYSSPGSSFVAQFIGETNLFPLHYANGSHCLPDATPVQSSPSHDYRYISIRPQYVKIAADAEDSDFIFQGSIIEKHYDGVTTKFTIRTNEKLTFHSVRLNSTNGAEKLNIGDNIKMGFCTSDIHFLQQ